MPATVLVIADHLDIGALISRALAGTGVRTLVASDVRQAGLMLQREACEVVVLDLAGPGHCDAVLQWLRRDPTRATMGTVRVSALARHGGVPRGEIRADMYVPKPFTPRQIADAVRTVLARRIARQRIATPAAPVTVAPAVLRPSATPLDPATTRSA